MHLDSVQTPGPADSLSKTIDIFVPLCYAECCINIYKMECKAYGPVISQESQSLYVGKSPLLQSLWSNNLMHMFRVESITI